MHRISEWSSGRRDDRPRKVWVGRKRVGGELGAAVGVMLALLLSRTAAAHPEYQRSLVLNTGRAVNCAYCHTSADGPEGTGLGQIGRLSPSELEQLGRARAALQPGAGVESPILNAFGNHILNVVGKARILELRLAPQELAGALPAGSDLDADGIEDAEEYRDGTHPLIDSDGDPIRLFRHNLGRYAWQIVLTFAATVLGLWGLKHLLDGFEILARRPEDGETTTRGK
ncbi:MAG: hypothetical protein IPK72_11620 [Candidatus Eisenbacteria bacterium]|nr:hypothetical protein [Candidatus Eisenbacteria bacterium]